MICIFIFMGKLLRLRGEDFFDCSPLDSLEKTNTAIPLGNRRVGYVYKISMENHLPNSGFFFFCRWAD